MSASEFNYDMNYERRGIALVINIRYFDPNPDIEKQLEERVWSEKDVENLRKTFEYLEFDFKLLENLKAEEIKANMQALGKYINHSNSDCFLCVVMSHGSQEKIMGSDNKEISFEDIMAPIKSCTSLMNKPKIFLFQACRGEYEMESPINHQTKQNQTKISTMIDGSIKEDYLNMTDSLPFDGKVRTKIETESDLLVYYSTLKNYVSFAFNDAREGTYFIKSVCDVFNEAYKNLPQNMSLSRMILNINKRVRDEGKALADPRSTLTKEIYFKPKKVSILKREREKFSIYFIAK